MHNTNQSKNIYKIEKKIKRIEILDLDNTEITNYSLLIFIFGRLIANI